MKTLIRRNVRSAMLTKRILKKVEKLNQTVAILASAVKRLEEENANLVAEIIALKNTKVETIYVLGRAPEEKPIVESVTVDKKTIVESVTVDKKTIVESVTVEMVRSSLKWLEENESTIQKIHKNFVYKYNYLAKQMRIRSVILENIAIGWSDDAYVDMKIKRTILKFAQKMGYAGTNE